MDWTTSFSLPSQHLLTKNDLLTTLPTLSNEWRVTFDFYPTSYNYRGYAQILQMTTNGRSGKIGDRTPALWIHNTRGVYIATTLNGKPSVGKFFKTKKPPLNQWTTIEIIQAKKGSVFMFSLAMGGETLWSVENSDPRQFSDVKVFTSSEWYEAQAGFIRGFKIENMMTGEKSIYPSPISYALPTMESNSSTDYQFPHPNGATGVAARKLAHDQNHPALSAVEPLTLVFWKQRGRSVIHQVLNDSQALCYLGL